MCANRKNVLIDRLLCDLWCKISRKFMDPKQLQTPNHGGALYACVFMCHKNNAMCICLRVIYAASRRLITNERLLNKIEGATRCRPLSRSA